MTLLFIGIGGFLGAIARFILSQWINRSFSSLPVGTLFVNLLGSGLLGLITGAAIPHHEQFLYGVGFLGAFTTFSTLNFEVLQMLKQQSKQWSLLYLLLSYSLGMLLAYGGLWLGNELRMLMH